MYQYIEKDMSSIIGFTWACPNFHNFIKQESDLVQFESDLDHLGDKGNDLKALFRYRYKEDKTNYETSVLMKMRLSEYFKLRLKLFQQMYTDLIAMHKCSTDYSNPSTEICQACIRRYLADHSSPNHKPLGELGLSMKTYKLLTDAGIFYVDQLDNNLDAVIRLEGIGKVRLAEIENALSMFLKLPTYVPIEPVKSKWDEGLIMLQGDFSDRLAYILEVMGWSKGELARRAGLSTRTIRYWLERRSLPDKKNQLKLADTLGVTVHCLLADPKKYKLFERTTTG